MASMNEKSGAIKRFKPETSGGMGFAVPEVTDAAVWIEDDKQNYMRSMPSMVNGVIDGLKGEHMRVESNLERISAFVVKGGQEEFTLSDTTIRLSGYGASDFTSRGAGMLAWKDAKVNLKNVDIETFGAGRPCTVATEGSVMKVYDSRLATHGGQLPPDYKPVIGPGMMEPPFPLGLGGNCRTHLSMSGSECFFYNCDIFAQGWAALSTDSSGGYLYLEANDCRVEVPGNGYITYADNGCHVCMNRCTANTGNMLVIQDGNSSVELNDVEADCKGYGFLLHGGMAEWKDAGIIEINGGSIHTHEEIFRAKSTNVDMYVKGAKLSADNGVILRSMVTDDEFYGRNRTQGPDCYGVQVTFEAMDIDGSILHDDNERKMNVSLVDTTIKGAITGGAQVSFYGESKFFATGDSRIVNSQDLKGLVDAAPGVTLTVVAEGKEAASFDLPSGGKLVIE